MINKNNISFIAPRIINAILITGLIAFEWFNVSTTANALETLVPMNLGIILAVAFCATDIAGLVRIVTPAKSMKEEPLLVKMLFGVWFVIAIINAFLTWFSLQVYFDDTAIKVPAVMQDAKFVIPIILAFVIFVIHFTVIYSLGIFLEKVTMPENVRATYRPNSQSTSQPSQSPVVSRSQSPTVGQRSVFDRTSSSPSSVTPYRSLSEASSDKE